MNKQELIDYCNAIKENKSQIINCIDVNRIIKRIEQLDEPQKVVVPQFVADWIEYFKKYSGLLYGSIAPYSYYEHTITDDFVGDIKKTLEWIRNNSETYARAWLDGYEVEKEKRYLVKVKGINGFGCYLNKGLLSKEYFFESKAEIGGCRTKHTRKQLEDDDFGWVFDCEGIEIEEVEKELNNDQ